MKLKTLLNGAVLFIGLGLAAYSQLNKGNQRSRLATVEPPVETQEITPEVWYLKENSIYDGDTLRVRRGESELKIRFCGTDSPEIKQPMGIEARDHLRSEAMPKAYRSLSWAMVNYF